MFSYNKSLDSLTLYKPGKNKKNAIKLSSNENAWGFSKKVKQNLKQAIKKTYIYPDSTSLILREELSNLLNIPKENFVLGNGSNELIDILIRIFMGSQGDGITGEYAFLIYKLIAKTLGKDLLIAKTDNFKNNVQHIIDLITDRTSIILIDNPNNPTGTYLTETEINQLIKITEEKDIILVIDEAYCEFARAKDYKSFADKVLEHKNLVIAKTFSKVYGLSALRLGYLIANKWIIDLVNKVRAPFNVNYFAQIAGQAALKDQNFVKNTITKTQKGIDYLTKELKPYCDIIPSQANFITAKLKIKYSNINIVKLLEENNIIIRPLDAYNLKNYFRITIGTKNQNKKLIKVIKTILQN